MSLHAVNEFLPNDVQGKTLARVAPKAFPDACIGRLF